jgi:TonB family protein
MVFRRPVLTRILLVGLAVFWCPVASLCGAAKQDNPRDHVWHAEYLFYHCDPAGAVLEYNIALRLKPSLEKVVRTRLAAAHFILSERLGRKKNIPGSLFELKQALELKPKEAYWHLAMALLKEKAGEHASAQEECKQATQLEPEDPGLSETCKNLGEKISYSGDEKSPDPQAQAFTDLTVVKGDASEPVPLHIPRVSPSWEASRNGYRGTVAMIITVSAEGRVSDLRVIKPMGLGLDKKALRTVRKIVFKPALRKGSPVETRVLVEVAFGPSCH